MATDYRPSTACCSTPVIIGPHYECRGTFVDVEGIRVYRSGVESSPRALFVIYDIFGYSGQILRGVDFLADQGYQIFMPDFFDGKPAPLSWMPMPNAQNEEPAPDEDAMTRFCAGPGNTERTKELVLKLRGVFQAETPAIRSWGLVGYCWGGYLANYLLDASSPFKVAAELHPGFPGREVAEQISRPLLALCSKDEPESEYADFKPHLKSEAQFVHFPNMLHGWMSARGDLTKPDVEKEFLRGYDMLAQWFDKYL